MKAANDEFVERRGKSAELIEHMLAERNQLLGLMLQVNEAEVSGNEQDVLERMAEFRQVLVDYIAAGHFGLYERIVAGNERRIAVSDRAVDLYPKIENVTEIALAFDEKYDPEEQQPSYSNLHEDLSRLGEELTTRIELEDELIKLVLPKRVEA